MAEISRKTIENCISMSKIDLLLHILQRNNFFIKKKKQDKSIQKKYFFIKKDGYILKINQQIDQNLKKT